MAAAFFLLERRRRLSALSCFLQTALLRTRPQHAHPTTFERYFSVHTAAPFILYSSRCTIRDAQTHTHTHSRSPAQAPRRRTPLPPSSLLLRLRRVRFVIRRVSTAVLCPTQHNSQSDRCVITQSSHRCGVCVVVAAMHRRCAWWPRRRPRERVTPPLVPRAQTFDAQSGDDTMSRPSITQTISSIAEFFLSDRHRPFIPEQTLRTNSDRDIRSRLAVNIPAYKRPELSSTLSSSTKR